ncbi:hypothetical protein ACER0C_017777 [Sarotherodon galilaeus]
MEQKVSMNMTIIVNDLHPCYVIQDSKYMLTTSPSIICVFLYALLALLSVITICGNLLVIISVIYFKQLHTPTNSLILSLAVADLLVGIIAFPLSMAFSLSSCLYHEGLFCKVRGTFDISLSTCSILNLCCISIDRYHAVCQPLTYQTKISHRVVVFMILMSWGVSGIIGISFFSYVGLLTFFLYIIFQPITYNETPIAVIEKLNWLTLSNSMLNPFIYAFFYCWFRSAFITIISGKIFQGDLFNSKLL